MLSPKSTCRARVWSVSPICSSICSSECRASAGSLVAREDMTAPLALRRSGVNPRPSRSFLSCGSTGSSVSIAMSNFWGSLRLSGCVRRR